MITYLCGGGSATEKLPSRRLRGAAPGARETRVHKVGGRFVIKRAALFMSPPAVAARINLIRYLISSHAM